MADASQGTWSPQAPGSRPDPGTADSTAVLDVEGAGGFEPSDASDFSNGADEPDTSDQ
jgi:hypothetical protein